jgi:hypothetical protein
MTRKGVGCPQRIHHRTTNPVFGKCGELDVSIGIEAIERFKKSNRAKRGQVFRAKLTAGRKTFCDTPRQE